MRAGFLTALLLAACGFAALGAWQVERLHWKHALIARVDSRVHAPAVPVPARSDWPGVSDERDGYRHVLAVGQYLPGRDTQVQALTALGPGMWVLSPLQTADGIVLVNRGFVPDDGTAGAAPSGPVRVTGLLRVSEPHGRVLRSNDPAHGRWYSRDVAAIARARGLAGVAPYFIDADAGPDTGGWPRGGMTVVQFRDAHLQYALTWFALALLCLFAGWRVLTEPRRLRHHARDADPDPDPDQPTGT